jgi:outer membrane protease
MLGGVKELVYDNGYTVSELDWPVLPAFSAGARVDIGERSGLLAAVEIQLGIPANAGTMSDSDFLNGDGVKTHYSQADGNLETAVLLSVQTGWGVAFYIPGGGSGTLEPFVAFELMRLEWTAQNGYLQYPPETSAPFTPWSPSTPQTPVYGTGIIYSQSYLIPEAGVKGSFPLTGALTMTASFAVSPYMWCFDKDSHLFRQLDFYASMHGGLLLEPRLSATYRISAGTAVSLDVLYRHIAQLTGDASVEGTGASGYTLPPQYPLGVQTPEGPNTAGVSLDVVTITVLLQLGL